jgi:hypothetical protein
MKERGAQQLDQHGPPALPSVMIDDSTFLALMQGWENGFRITNCIAQIELPHTGGVGL